MHNIQNKGVAVYCASSNNIAPEFIQQARTVGKLLAHAGVPVVSGGGSADLWQPLSKALSNQEDKP